MFLKIWQIAQNTKDLNIKFTEALLITFYYTDWICRVLFLLLYCSVTTMSCRRACTFMGKNTSCI